jgi:hypothetical protein
VPKSCWATGARWKDLLPRRLRFVVPHGLMAVGARVGFRHQSPISEEFSVDGGGPARR